MTFLEKFKIDHPNAPMSIDGGHPNGCPYYLGYENSAFCDEPITCIECWNREMPKTRLDALLEVFPNTVLNSCGTPQFCTMFLGLEHEECDSTTCLECWDKIYIN